MKQISLYEGAEPLRITKPIRLIELFAGIGAQAKALEILGVPFEHYRICEFDRFAVASYNAIHGTAFKVSDITQIQAEDLGVCDTDKYTYILTYSFPCTDLSVAGKSAGMAKGSGTRSGLLWEVERLLNEMDELPQILLMENVPQVVGKKNKADFAEWISALDRLGYTSKYTIMNATDYGVPQNRKRCFMVSWLGDYYFDFPAPIPLHKRLKDMLEERVDESYYLPDEVAARLLGDASKRERERDSVDNQNGWQKKQTIAEERCCMIECREIANLALAGVKGYNEMNGRVYSANGTCPALRANSGGHNEIKIAAIRGRNPDKPTARTAGLPTEQQLEIGGKCATNTLTTVQKDNVVVEPHFRIRKLTPRECWRLMDFDDEDFDRAIAMNSKTQLYKQAGNSIVVNCLVAIFGQMIEGKENVYKERKEPQP